MSQDKKILYIEDNVANLTLVDKVLQLVAGVELVSARTGELGIELARELKPDLVLLDINLPGMNGYDVLKSLRADAELADVPVIAMTASATRADLQEGLRAGFDDYLTKPFDIRKFLGLVEEYLDIGSAFEAFA